MLDIAGVRLLATQLIEAGRVIQPMPSIALVVLDTLRKDAFDRHFGWLPGRRFETTFSTSHWTVPAHASLFTERYPSELGVCGQAPQLRFGGATLAERLQAAGYRTRLLTANVQLARWDGWERGFDAVVGPEYLDHRQGTFDWPAFLERSDASGVGLYLRGLQQCLVSDCSTISSIRAGYRRWRRHSADRLGGAMRDQLQQTDFGNREFLFLNLMEAHAPHYPPAEYRRVDKEVEFVSADAFGGTAPDRATAREAYDGSVAHLSAMYRDIFETLRTSFDYVITCSDHGELLGEHDRWSHGYGLYPELAEVPLVLTGPDLAGESKTPTSFLDVHRTVASLAGLPDASRGRDLTNDEPPTARLVEYHGFPLWMERHFRQRGVSESRYRPLKRPLNGLITAAGTYGYETHEQGLRVENGAAQTVARELASVTATLNQKPVTEAELEVDDRLREQLEALGYA